MSADRYTYRATWSAEDGEHVAMQAAEQGVSLNRLASAKLAA